MKVKYFAYGSNMSSARLQDRAPSAQATGRAKLYDRRLVFNKASNDGSTKANIEFSFGDVVWGVLYKLDEKDLQKVDDTEGGYERIEVDVSIDSGGTIKAFSYVSTNTTTNCKPYDWYLDYILVGAKEHGLPQQYITELQKVQIKKIDKTM